VLLGSMSSLQTLHVVSYTMASQHFYPVLAFVIQTRLRPEFYFALEYPCKRHLTNDIRIISQLLRRLTRSEDCPCVSVTRRIQFRYGWTILMSLRLSNVRGKNGSNFIVNELSLLQRVTATFLRHPILFGFLVGEALLVS